MSTPNKSLSEKIKEQAEIHKRKLELLESGELQRMIDEYEHCLKRIPILKAEIKDILGVSLEEEPKATENPEQQRSNRPKKSPQEVLKEMVDLLKAHPEGLKKKEIAERLKVGLPKVDEAFSQDKSLFAERNRGPKAVIKLKA